MSNLVHGMNCPALGAVSDAGCTCGLRYRIELQTEREMHNAWKKRAEEAEAASPSREAIVMAIQQTVEIKAAKYGAFDVNCEAIADAILALSRT